MTTPGVPVPPPGDADSAEQPRRAAARHHQFIVTIYGLYGRHRQGALPVATLITLMSDLGVGPAGVRSSVSRLKKRGILESVRLGSAAAYQLTPAMEEVFREGDARIFSGRHDDDVAWGLLAVTVPESERSKRHRVRVTLTRLGFGTVMPGLWVAPAPSLGHAKRELERAGLVGYADFFTARYGSPESLPGKVAQWWDLDALDAMYTSFAQRYETMRARWLGDGPLPADDGERDRAGFADYIPLLTEWRRLPYLDPGLPRAFLPEGWAGFVAEDLFSTLHEALSGPAGRHARAVIAGQR